MKTIFLGCYSPNAVKGLIGGSDRRAAVEALLATVGGKLESMFFTRGEYDIALVAEFEDRETAMGLTMAIQASGAFSKMCILEELDMEKVLPSAQAAAKVYQPAG